MNEILPLRVSLPLKCASVGNTVKKLCKILCPKSESFIKQMTHFPALCFYGFYVMDPVGVWGSL